MINLLYKRAKGMQKISKNVYQFSCKYKSENYKSKRPSAESGKCLLLLSIPEVEKNEQITGCARKKSRMNLIHWQHLK